MIALRKLFIANLTLLACLHAVLFADWPCRTDSSVALSTNAGNQWNIQLVSDRKNGAIMVWQDRRSGINDKLYVQRVSSSGLSLWPDGGIQLADASGYQYYPEIIADGLGGAYVVWQDNRNGRDYDIFIQRVDAAGSPWWNATGRPVCQAIGHQYYPQLISDGQGGVIVTWQDRRNGQNDIYAQRFDGFGRLVWTHGDTLGQPVCTDTSEQVNPQLASDGAGGAYIVWEDYRSGSGFQDIYCQRILSSGQRGWTTDLRICIAPNIQRRAAIISDGTGGAIICWQDRRDGKTENIYAQRVDGLGQIKWQADGIPVAYSTGLQYYPKMVSDRTGGAIIVWQDNRKGTDYDIYGQRINALGQLLWSLSGLGVCKELGDQYDPQLIIQAPYVLVTWADRRGADFDIYLQELDLNGTPQWAKDGVPVCTAPRDQFMPGIASDSTQGAIVAWADYRLGSGYTDVFAQRLGANGLPAGGCFKTFVQGDFSQKAIRYKLGRDRIVAMPGAGNVLDSIFGRGALPDGMVIGIDRSDSSWYYGWEYFARSIFCRRALPQNGTARPFAINGYRYFAGRFINPSVKRYNNSLAGELMTLKLNILASDVGLTKEGLGDLIFRDTSKLANPLNDRKLRDIATFTDSLLTLWRHFSNISYPDIGKTLSRINQAFTCLFDTVSTKPLRIRCGKPAFSLPFLRPSPGSPTVIPHFAPQYTDDGVPQQITLYQNYPNPFNPYTTIEFTLPEPAVVTLSVYNILGQQVSLLIDHAFMDDERQVVDFDASHLSSGVYFYRLLAEPLSGGAAKGQVKKMIVLK